MVCLSPKKNGVMTWPPKHPIAFVATSFPEPSPQPQALSMPLEMAWSMSHLRFMATHLAVLFFLKWQSSPF